MILENINGKKLSLVVWGTDKKGEDDVQVFAGIARHENDKLYLERDDGKILIQDEWLNKIKPIQDSEIQEILLDADYFISLSIGNLPEDEDILKLIKLPIKWNEKP